MAMAVLACCLCCCAVEESCGQEWFTRPPHLTAAHRKALDAPVGDVEPWKELAALAIEHQYVVLASQAAARVRRTRPEDLEARYFQGLARLRTVIDQENKGAGYEEGLQILAALPESFQRERALKPVLQAARDAISAEQTIKRAFQDNSAGGFLEATRILESAAANDPDNLVYRETLVWLYLEKLQQPARAYPHAALVASKLPGAEDLSRALDALKGFAFIAAETGRHNEAAQALERLMQWDPQDRTTRLQLAKASLAAGRLGRALELFQGLEAQSSNEEAKQAIAKYLGPTLPSDRERPRFIAALERAIQQLRHAETSGDMGQYELAAEQFEIAIQDHPQSKFARQTLGWIYLEKLGRPGAALPHLAVAAGVGSSDAAPLILLGMANYRLGRFSEAISLYRQALIQQPNDLGLRANLGRALARAECFADAMSEYSEVLDRAAPGSKEHALAELGTAEIRAWEGETRPPLRVGQNLVAQNPQFTEAWLLLADLHRWSWDLTVAEDEYRRVLALAPGHEEALQGLADIALLRARNAAFDAYNFTDSFEFSRTNYRESFRFPVSDKHYLTCAFDQWEFAQQANYAQRTEGRIGLEHHATRTITLNANYWTYDYTDFAPEHAWSIGGRVSPVGMPSLSVSYANNEPAYLDSINVPLMNIRMDSLAGGIDIPMNVCLSFQGEYSESLYSDDNRRRFASGQLSREIFPEWGQCYFRLRYEFLTYEDESPNYFSPKQYHLIRPMLDCRCPISDRISLTMRLESPYVQQEGGGFGYTVMIGPEIRLGERLQLRGHYLRTSLPTDNPFSGDVFVIHASATF